MFNLLSPQERNEAILIFEDMPIEELRKFYTLSKYDFTNIEKYKTNPNRLGFAVQLCVLRHKGWTLNYIQNIPVSVIEYIAQQLNMSPNHYEHYYNRKNTIFDHFKDIKSIYDYKELNEENIGNLIAFLESLFEKSDNSYFLISGCIERLKSLRIVLPAIYRIEEIVGEAKVSNETKVIDIITEFLTDDQKKKIDFLLELYGESNFSSLAWLRDDIGKPSTDTLLEVIKRIDKIDDIKFKLDLSGIPSYKIEQFIRLGRRYEPFSLRRFEDRKRHAIMSVYLMDLKQCLIDKAITIHDLKMNGIFGKIKNNQAELVKKQRKYIKEAINDYVVFGNTVIEANDSKKDIGKTIENKITWEKFKKSVQDAEKLSNKTKKSTLDMLNSYYGELRKYTPILLKKLSFENTSNNCNELVNAIDIVKDLNKSKKINLPEGVEINFVNKMWKDYIEKKEGSEKRHYYEIAVLNELKNKVRSGDISVVGSKEFKSFEEYLVSENDWELERNQTRLAAQNDFKEYIAERKKELQILLNNAFS